MKKLILITCIAVISCSCGASKKNKQTEKLKEVVESSEKTNVKKLDTAKLETNTTASGSISFENLINMYSFEPFDNTKPFFIGDKEFKNVKVVSTEEKTNYKEESKSDIKQLEARYLSESKETDKQYKQEKESLKTEKYKETSHPFIPYFIIALLVLLLLYIIDKKYLNKTKL